MQGSRADLCCERTRTTDAGGTKKQAVKRRNIAAPAVAQAKEVVG